MCSYTNPTLIGLKLSLSEDSFPDDDGDGGGGCGGSGGGGSGGDEKLRD